ncbi:unnamed protein product [Moneuplotes crassus]|uniref:Uncharacterized protein n=1 Tax=Euplotes crassus TaxID=5936 RepID=A0AAD1YA47_EUPCR|nr:unnamed protein product [Moneuplotes crassus]
MFPIDSTADAIVNDYPIKFERKKKFPSMNQHWLENNEISPESSRPFHLKSSYQTNHSGLVYDQRRWAKERDLKKIQRTNPQGLPPAGKNFYDFSGKKKFVDAHKLGSINFHISSAVYNRNSKIANYKLDQKKRKTGKRMFRADHDSDRAIQPPLLFESPKVMMMKYKKINDFDQQFDDSKAHYRTLNRKPPINPIRYGRNQLLDTKTPSELNSRLTPIEKTRNNESRNSSMSKLGGRNYSNMIIDPTKNLDYLENQVNNELVAGNNNQFNTKIDKCNNFSSEA